MQIQYPLSYTKRKSKAVPVGKIAIGGENSIRLQSMLTNSTRDIDLCVKEIKTLVSAGAELIRITIPNRKDLEGAEKTIAQIHSEGIDIPFIADVHFSPNMAEEACEFFDKVRINPGNFADKSKSVIGRFQQGDDFLIGQEKLKENLVPLVKNLKKYNRALRVGVNQGSLALRMIEKFGDTPVGMVQSALETIALLEELEFYNIIISLKSSNPMIVQQAYRLMAQSLKPEQNYPFHLGVTEAGNEAIGRIKGICGIGSLLADGIGDTIRVSLTEPSQNEIIFGKKLLDFLYQARYQTNNQTNYWQRHVERPRLMGGAIETEQTSIGNASAVKLGVIETRNKQYANEYDWDFTYQCTENDFAIDSIKTFLIKKNQKSQNIDLHQTLLFDSSLSIYDMRSICQKQLNKKKNYGYLFPEKIDADDFSQEIKLAMLLGEGLLDFILFHPKANAVVFNRFANLMQATRVKLMTPDYIACPSCGRTLFQIQDVVSEIKKATSHLKNVKIAIMGCIVNGPGEMADADFGYVGAATGKIDLYRGREKIKRNIPQKDAISSLIHLIQQEGMWTEPLK